MTEQEVMEIFWRNNAIVQGHFRLSSGQHTDIYIDKDAVIARPQEIRLLGDGLADKLIRQFNPDVIIGPQIGGALVAQWTAYYLSDRRRGQDPALAVYAEKTEAGFKIRPRLIELMRGKKVVIIDDVLTSGDSVTTLAETLKDLGIEPAGVGVIWDRSDGFLSSDLLLKLDLKLVSLIRRVYSLWPPEKGKCPLCLRNISINTVLGHGKNY